MDSTKGAPITKGAFYRKVLPSLAVRDRLATPAAELVQLHTVRIVAAILLGDVVTLFALSAGQRDFGPDVGSLGSHCILQ